MMGKIGDGVNKVKLKELVTDLYRTGRRFIICTKNIGAWMNVWDTMVTGTVLAATGFEISELDNGELEM